VHVSVSLTRPLLQPWRQAVLGAVAATRLGDTKRVMTLGRACGRYVDWYGKSRGSQGGARAAAGR
jgi:hypothetical protein